MSSELNEIDPMNILLAVDVPDSASPGSTFHVELKNRFFEVNHFYAMLIIVIVNEAILRKLSKILPLSK